MKICPACQAEMEDSVKYCLVCGRFLGETAPEPEAPVGEAAEPEAPAAEEDPAEEAPAQEPEPAEEPVAEPDEPAEPAEPEEPAEPAAPAAEEDKTEEAPQKEENSLSTLQYFLLEALFAVPVIGIVFMFIWSLGQPKNGALKRFSASVLIWRLILYIILFTLFISLLLTAGRWVPRIAGLISTVRSVLTH